MGSRREPGRRSGRDQANDATLADWRGNTGRSTCPAVVPCSSRPPFHEARLLALLILVRAYERGDEARREEVCRLYLDHLPYVNNWGLVDGTAEHILGRHLRDRDRSILFELARSSSVWERRIAIMATFGYVKAGSFDETLRLQYLRGEVETEGREGAGG